MKPDIVLGGGVAGLAAARLLAQQSPRPVVLLERQAELGGLAASWDWEGCRLDFGPHRIYTLFPAIERYLLALLGEDVLRVKRRSSMYLRGRFVKYPVALSEILSNLGMGCAARIGLSYAWSLATRWTGAPEQEQSYAQFLSSRFGRYLYELLFRDYARKVWQEDPGHLSSRMARTRLATPSLWHSFREALRPTGKNTVSEFLYPRGGIGRIAERLGEEILATGGRLLRRHEVRAVVVRQGKVCSIKGRSPEGPFEMEPEHVISTLPLPLLFDALDPPAPAEVSQALEELPFGCTILTYVLFDHPQVREDCWLYFPAAEQIFSRIYEVNNFDRDNVPAGQSCLCVEVPCREGDALWSLSDEAIQQRVHQDLARVGLGQPERRHHSTTIRLKHAYPIYRQGYEAALSEVISYLSEIHNLISTGRGGAFCYNNLDHSIDMGLLAAEYTLREHREGKETSRFYRLRSRFDEYRIVD